jgi:NTE family protein
LAANAPIEALHLCENQGDLTCFILDVYARDGERPHDLESSMSRKSDLMFSNQTWQRLVAYKREKELQNKVFHLSQKGRPGKTKILYLSYRPRREEAGPERGYDYSSRMLERRWETGAADMLEAIMQLESVGKTAEDVIVKAIRRSETIVGDSRVA